MSDSIPPSFQPEFVERDGQVVWDFHMALSFEKPADPASEALLRARLRTAAYQALCQAIGIEPAVYVKPRAGRATKGTRR